MLVLSRKEDESIQFGEVTITVSKISGNRLSLDFIAPQRIKILRSELKDSPSPDANEHLDKISLLTLSRKEGLSVWLPEMQITVTVTEIRGNRAKIGIEAPREVKITRLKAQAA